MQIKKVIRSKRKTIALQICDDATLIVRAPFGVSKNIIRHTILKHHKWLENKKREILSRNLILTKRKFVNGELFLYMGKSYPLKMIPKNDLEEPLFLNDGYFTCKRMWFIVEKFSFPGIKEQLMRRYHKESIGMH